MKKIRWKNIIRNIKGSFNRFLSILFIVALGAGFMAGLAAASPDMYDTADAYIKEYNLFDLDIKSTIGLTKEDEEELASQDYIQQIEAADVFDMILEKDENTEFTSRVFGILKNDSQQEINRINLIEGRMPENSSECVVESIFGKYSGEQIEIGDQLVLASANTNYDSLNSYMSSTTLTVVGICQSPMCLSIEGDSTNIGSGTINLNVYTLQETFCCDFYTDFFLTINGASDFNTFDDAYSELINSVSEKIREIGSKRTKIRADELTSSYDEQLSMLKNIQNYAQDLNTIETSLQEKYKEGKLLNTSIIDVLPSISNIQLSEYLDTANNLSEEKQSSSAADRLEIINNKISEAEEALQQLESSSWILRTRSDLTGFESYSSNVGKVSALAKIFPVFFFIVALLVALTTMTRLIEEKRLQIGTLKALGYSNYQILFEYLLFSFSASILGSFIGFLIGFQIFPKAISSAYSMMYTLPDIATPIRWNIIAWVAPVTIVSILLASLWACWNEFRSVPAALMQPKSPAAGKRIWLEHIPFIWKKLSFTYKVTFRNLFRYKKRFIMTIIGVAGCSALLLTGFGIKDSVNDIVDKQFGEIYKFEFLFSADKESSFAEGSSLYKILSDKTKIASYCSVCQETGKIYAGNEKQEITLFSPEDLSDLDEFIEIRSRKSAKKIELTENGIILTEKICEEMNIKKGDTITLENEKGVQTEAVVIDIAEFYVSSMAFMTPEFYEKSFSSKPEFTKLLCTMPDNGLTDTEKSEFSSAILTEVMSDSHILYGRSTQSLKDSFSDSIKSINGVVYVLIAAAGLLCIVVLYNLTNVNICERKKELATLRVLGFYKNETQNYIFRETNILSFLGALVGLLLGIWLHQIVVKTVEVNHIMFGREIKPLSYLIALAISVVFTLCVDLIMKRPINKTDMVEAMKAND